MYLSEEPKLRNTLVQALVECVVVVGLLIFLASPLIGVLYEKEFALKAATHESTAVAIPGKKN